MSDMYDTYTWHGFDSFYTPFSRTSECFVFDSILKNRIYISTFLFEPACIAFASGTKT